MFPPIAMPSMDPFKKSMEAQPGDCPIQRPDGKWVIGYDDSGDPVILDDINCLDNETRDCLLLQQKNSGIDLTAFRPDSSATVPTSSMSSSSSPTSMPNASDYSTQCDSSSAAYISNMFDPTGSINGLISSTDAFSSNCTVTTSSSANNDCVPSSSQNNILTTTTTVTATTVTTTTAAAAAQVGAVESTDDIYDNLRLLTPDIPNGIPNSVFEEATNYEQALVPWVPIEPKPGLVGLTNLGNTCYMNSGLQCLFSNTRLVDYFLYSFQKHSRRFNLPNNSLSASFIKLLRTVWNVERDERTLKPSEFKDILGETYPQFKGCRQHDCQEFLTLLLGTIHDQLVMAFKNPPPAQNPLDLLLLDNEVKKLDKLEETDRFNPSPSTFSNPSPSLPENCSHVTSPKSSDSVSTLSSASSTSGDHLNDDEDHIRSHPIPAHLKNFSTIAANAIDSTVGATRPIATINNQLKTPDKNCNIQSESLSSTPDQEPESSSICSPDSPITLAVEDFVKENKTLNTNVLVENDINNRLNFNSSKFPRKKKEIVGEQVDNLRQARDLTVASGDIVQFNIDKNTTVDKENVDFVEVIKVVSKKRINESLDMFDVTTVDSNLESEIPKKNSPKRLKSSCSETEEEERSQELGDAAADAEWSRYLNENNSIIVENFQGQFKSTVKCYVCDYVSITYEPFMYLPVPLPFALEIQFPITFVPITKTGLDNRFDAERKFLVTCNKHDRYSKVIDMLRKMLVEQSLASDQTDITLAEVEDNFVCKLIDPCSLVQNKLPNTRNLYAFEMHELQFTTSHAVCANENLYPKTLSIGIEPTSTSILMSPSSFEVPNNFSPKHSSGSLDLPQIFNEIRNEEPTQSTIPEVDLTQDIQMSHQPFIGPLLPSQLLQPSSSQSVTKLNDEDIYMYYENDQNRPPNNVLNGFLSPSIAEVAPSNIRSEIPSSTFEPSPDQSNSQFSCAICLEGKPFSLLLGHTNCECKICSLCLEMTIQHLSSDKTKVSCPVCYGLVERNQFQFINLLAPPIQTIRVLTLCLMFRVHAPGHHQYKSYRLALPPILLRLPSLVSASELYETIDKFVPFPSAYSLHYVSRNGQGCSRCVWNCSGCKIPRIGDIRLYPDDRIAVEFDKTPDFDENLPINWLSVKEHESMQTMRLDRELTLYDCIQAFNECEILDDDNPWFCPECRRYQRAKKSLSVWKCPDTLMIYLKRFVFHEMNSIKVDNSVTFPLQGLDMSPYVHGPQKDNEFSLQYHLQSVVCHSGSVNSGHYTAFAKYGPTGNWHYFNDEQVQERNPDHNDDRAYILFYQRPHNWTCPPLSRSKKQEDVPEVELVESTTSQDELQ